MSLYKRVLIKLSGDALGGQKGYGIDDTQVERFLSEVSPALQKGIQIGVVVGGGNILRGAEREKSGADRVSSDAMGMLATMINGLAIADIFKQKGLPCEVLSAKPIEGVIERFNRDKALSLLEKGMVIFVGGTGNPFFTTDSAAALRASEIRADILLKATKVDGIYDKDPVKFDDAVLYKKLQYSDVLQKKLKVMDAAAVSISSENNIPIRVFNFNRENQLKAILSGEALGTLVEGE